uniref:Uncharacterized protein n=1 Tax=Heterorhabditis bacteriophora TaxID=37862 RepID=A0A1I7X344_HETBA
MDLTDLISVRSPLPHRFLILLNDPLLDNFSSMKGIHVHRSSMLQNRPGLLETICTSAL